MSRARRRFGESDEEAGHKRTKQEQAPFLRLSYLTKKKPTLFKLELWNIHKLVWITPRETGGLLGNNWDSGADRGPYGISFLPTRQFCPIDCPICLSTGVRMNLDVNYKIQAGV